MIRSISYLILSVSIFSFSALSSASPSSGIKRPVLIVGLSETDYYPFYFEQDGQIVGAAAEVVTHLAHKLKYQLKYKRFPWKRVQHNLAKGKIDMVLLYFKTPERAEHVYYVDVPHVYESSSLIVRHDSSIKYSGDLNQLLANTFGNVNGYWHGASYSEHKTLKRREFSSTEELLTGLKRGSIDIAVGNKPVMLQIAKTMGHEDQFAFLEPKIDYAPDYIAFSKAKPKAKERVKAFSKALKPFLKTTKYRQIFEKYGFDIAPK